MSALEWRITAICMGKRGSSHEHIEAVKIENKDTGYAEWEDIGDAVKWVRNNPLVYVNGSTARVKVVEDDPPYLRSEPNLTGKDNLLTLPRCNRGGWQPE